MDSCMQHLRSSRTKHGLKLAVSISVGLSGAVPALLTAQQQGTEPVIGFRSHRVASQHAEACKGLDAAIEGIQ